MKKIIPLLLIFIINQKINAQEKHATGLIFDAEKYKKIEIISPALKFTDANRTNYSLKKYCPTPGDQKDIGSCTSWAWGYAGLSISEAIYKNNLDTKNITDNTKSALFIFKQIRHDCKNGALLSDAADFLKNIGDCDLKDFNPQNCNEYPSEFLKKKKLLKISEYNKLFEPNSNYENKISQTINIINSNKPVIIGLNIKPSLKYLKKEKYEPKDSEIDDGSHALCVIGYDNIKSEFEIINSWGETNFGNKGFFKISYKDYAKYTFEAYSFSLNIESIDYNDGLKGNFEILKFNGVNQTSKQNEFNIVTPYLSSDNCYYLTNSIKKDDFFRIRASDLTKNSYVYIISYKPDKTVEILFPTHYNSKVDYKDIPFIPADNVSIELPVDSENAYSADQKGNDLLCILFSNERIQNIETFALNLKIKDGDIWGSLKNTFGSKLIDPSNLNFSTHKMALNSKQKIDGNIAALVLKTKVE
jgi:hypothetical protein